MPELINVKDADFAEQVLETKGLVLVDFWAPWCGPCKMITPILEAILASHEDKLKIVKVNVDEAQQTASQYGIRSIPSLLLIRDGEVLDTKIGALSQSQLTDWVDSFLA